MKNVLALVLFSVLAFNASTSFAQRSTEETESTNYITNKAITINANERNFSGSAYENKEFASGYVFKNGKTLASNVALRYNAKRDEIEVKNSLKSSNQSARVLVKNDDIYIKILNKVFVYSPVRKGIDKAGYFMVVHEGANYSLYKKLTKKFIEGREAINSITRDTPPAFQNKEAYYLVNKVDGSFTVFPKSRKGKLKVFSENKKEIKSFVKSNRLNVNKGYDLAKLVKYYDTL
ncbi:MAG: hypothetical protein AAF489_09655 [Bacteroidota bacterium]